jgi:hypothetical protein
MFVALQYLLFGVVLASFYVMLSGGGWICFVVASFLLPTALFLIELGRNFRFGGAVVSMYVLSPIILNGLAMLLQKVVGAEWASIVSMWRYDPIWIVPCLYVAIDLALYAANSRWRRRA